MKISEHNGFRNTYTHFASRPIGLIVIGVVNKHKPWKASRLARKASAALGLPYQELEYDPNVGFALPPSASVEEPYPCGPLPRWPSKPSAYINIEQGHYERWRSREFVVIASHGPPGSDLLRETLTKVRAAFPEAHEVKTRAVWIQVSSVKIADDVPPAVTTETEAKKAKRDFIFFRFSPTPPLL